MEIYQGEVVDDIPPRRPQPPNRKRRGFGCVSVILILMLCRFLGAWAEQSKRNLLNEQLAPQYTADAIRAARPTATPRPINTPTETATAYYLRTAVTPDDQSYTLEWYWEFDGNFRYDEILGTAEQWTVYVPADGEDSQGASYSTYEVDRVQNWNPQCVFEFSEGTLTIYTSENNAWFACGQLSDYLGQDYQTP